MSHCLLRLSLAALVTFTTTGPYSLPTELFFPRMTRDKACSMSVPLASNEMLNVVYPSNVRVTIVFKLSLVMIIDCTSGAAPCRTENPHVQFPLLTSVWHVLKSSVWLTDGNVDSHTLLHFWWHIVSPSAVKIYKKVVRASSLMIGQQRLTTCIAETFAQDFDQMVMQRQNLLWSYSSLQRSPLQWLFDEKTSEKIYHQLQCPPPLPRLNTESPSVSFC